VAAVAAPTVDPVPGTVRTMSALDGSPDLTDDELRALLERSRRIAVVGMSTDPRKAASRIPATLIQHGFDVVPVHPTAQEIQGRTAYPTLEDVPGHIDLVDVFRPPAEAAGVAASAVTVGANAIWLQLGIASAPARRIAEASGLVYVEDLCIGVEVQRLGVRH